MMDKQKVLFFAVAGAVLLAIIGIFISYPRLSPAPPEPDGISASSAVLIPEIFIVSGEVPLWFELAPGGPRRIDSPENAALVDFSPWPLSRHITSMDAAENRLVMASNRSGFLVSVPWSEDRIALFRIADENYWSDYTVASVFSLRGRSCILLYRDDFFTEPGQKLPDPRAFYLSRESPAPVAVDIGAFADQPPDEGWDIESLQRGNDGFWYYRAVQKDKAQGIRSYYRTADLETPGEACSSAAFINAQTPLHWQDAPGLLRPVLEAAAEMLGSGAVSVAEIISPDWDGTQYFILGTSANTGEQEFIQTYVYHSAGGSLAILPDGRGRYIRGDTSGGGYRSAAFSLPLLPDNYVYTGFALSGPSLIAAWEEQQGLSVGAAGFMVINDPGEKLFAE
ncbi:hypothetical protein [Breznakiella homolactica]|uniref:Uncharacterized protein n=1 Tax=Breznakiella homolactica TaxID=2798577 RepID=A0A7T7XRC5_9SPIR|nr:hypothetical protein [Breznakiella homolactica]QQO11063.1 hypothetical protein JFL75_09145 [Breznakiella homolactica]